MPTQVGKTVLLDCVFLTSDTGRIALVIYIRHVDRKTRAVKKEKESNEVEKKKIARSSAEVQPNMVCIVQKLNKTLPKKKQRYLYPQQEHKDSKGQKFKRIKEQYLSFFH